MEYVIGKKLEVLEQKLDLCLKALYPKEFEQAEQEIPEEDKPNKVVKPR